MLWLSFLLPCEPHRLIREIFAIVAYIALRVKGLMRSECVIKARELEIEQSRSDSRWMIRRN